MESSRVSSLALLDSLSPRRSTRTLPIEVWSSVFRFSGRNDLVQLCTVSAFFHHEAERTLYKNVNLSNTRLYGWAQRVSRQPHLAAQVKSLSASISQLRTSRLEELSVVHEALQAITNLEELTLRSWPTGLCLNPACVWILSECTFRLRVFRNFMFDLPPVIPFLSSQPSICLWEQQSATSTSDVLNDILPNLTSILVPPSVVKMQTSRPIREMSFSVGIVGRDGERDALSTLSRFGTTLRNLRLERMVSEDSLLLEHFISYLADCVPGLKHLSILNIGSSVCLEFSATPRCFEF